MQIPLFLAELREFLLKGQTAAVAQFRANLVVGTVKRCAQPEHRAESALVSGERRTLLTAQKSLIGYTLMT